ncbi:MAG: hypothetical protein CMH79_01965 [Nitrospinae bacterium]|nr:hypothetical protein [Nitrospinota bacterium]|tara:strand:+ start:959 stop:1384 length:426 start_codon:yes stop_codon:yes gene_type:complete
MYFRLIFLLIVSLSFISSFSFSEFVNAQTRKSSSTSVEKNLSGFDIPEIATSNFLGWDKRDFSKRIPGKETIIKQFLDEWGFQFETFSINKVVFAINLDLDGKYPFDVTFLDQNCDGVFETKIEEKPGESVDMGIPECVFK